MEPRDYGPFPYTPINDRPQLEWPGGARVAVWVIPNIEFFPLARGIAPHPGAPPGNPPSVRSGSVLTYLGRMLRDTHHAAVLENWGVLWMWHSLTVFLLCALTAGMAWARVGTKLGLGCT